jgi:hypothetical protein
MEQAGYTNKPSLRRGYQKCHTIFRHVLSKGFFNQDCAGLGNLQRGQVLAAFHEGHIIPACQVQRRNAAENARVITTRRKPKRGTQRAKRNGPG